MLNIPRRDLKQLIMWSIIANHEWKEDVVLLFGVLERVNWVVHMHMAHLHAYRPIAQYPPWVDADEVAAWVPMGDPNDMIG